jgi:6-phosphogluconate dehydrogenase (decarboxylating)
MYSPFAFYLSDKVASVCTVSNCLTCPGVNAARDALLTFMVGGEAKAFERAKEYLNCMGKNVVHCGPAGNGQVSS